MLLLSCMFLPRIVVGKLEKEQDKYLLDLLLSFLVYFVVLSHCYTSLWLSTMGSLWGAPCVDNSAFTAALKVGCGWPCLFCSCFYEVSVALDHKITYYMYMYHYLLFSPFFSSLATGRRRYCRCFWRPSVCRLSVCCPSVVCPGDLNFEHVEGLYRKEVLR